MHGSFLTFDRHQVVNGHQSEAKIEFAEFLFVCVVVDAGFCFWKDSTKKHACFVYCVWLLLLNSDIWK